MDWSQTFEDHGDALRPLLEGRIVRQLAARGVTAATYSPWVAYAISINYILGVGMLGLPYAVERVGIAVAVVILLLVSCVTFLTVQWIVEVLYSINYLTRKRYFDRTRPYYGSPLRVGYNKLLPPPTATTHLQSQYQPVIRNRTVSAESTDSDSSKAAYKSYGSISNHKPIQEDYFPLQLDVDSSSNGYNGSAAQPSSTAIANTPVRRLFKRLWRNVHPSKSSSTHSTSANKQPTIHHIDVAQYNLDEKYEVIQCIDLLIGKRAAKLYQVLLCFLMLSGLMAYTAVFQTSVLGVIPSITNSAAYDQLIITAVFASLVIPLSCLELSEQASIQVLLTIARFLTIAMMLVACLLGMWFDQHDSAVRDVRDIEPPYIRTEQLQEYHLTYIGLMFSTAVFSQLFQHSVPPIIAPLKQKQYIRVIFLATLLTTLILYLVLGTVCSLYFGHYIQPAVNLSFERFTWGWTAYYEHLPIWLKVLNYTIVLFPAFDTVSVFPLIAVTLGNSIRATLAPPEPSTHTHQQSHLLHKLSPRLMTVVTRLLATIPPIVLSLFVHDLSLILQVGGCFGILIALFVPAILQLAAQRAVHRQHLIAVDHAETSSSEPVQQWRSPFHSWYSNAFFVYTVMITGVLALVASIAPSSPAAA